jgi:hypothetical protein
MAGRALEFVETWVSEKIEAMNKLPAEDDEATPKALANECVAAALEEGIPATEIAEAFDDLAEFISGEIEEARERTDGAVDEDEVPLWARDAEEDEEEEDK